MKNDMMSGIYIELDQTQTRSVVVTFLVNYMVIFKQYLYIDTLKHFKTVIKEVANLQELEYIEDRFDSAFPKELIWSEL